MNDYSIQLPRTVSSLFEGTDYALGCDVPCVNVDVELFSAPTCHYIERSDTTADGRTRVSVCSPGDCAAKTAVVSRVLNTDGTLTLDVAYYGNLKVDHLRALGGYARDYGCSTVTVRRTMLETVTEW